MTPRERAAEWVEWHPRAACKGAAAIGISFFPEDRPDGEPETNRELYALAEARAKNVCATCPVQKECLRDGILYQEPRGVYGGVGSREREQWRKSKKVLQCETCHDMLSPAAIREGATRCPLHPIPKGDPK